MGKFFESMKNNMARIFKKAGKAIAIKMMPIVFIILITVIVTSGLVYETTKQDALPKQGDMSNVPYASNKYTADVTIDEQGKIITSMTAQELWDEMMKNESRVDEYLESPEELLKLMSAEIVTSYPNTRPNPDEAIDWDNLNKNINSKETQGIIKFKRAKDDDTTVTMSYVDSKTFYDWIEQYNTTGDEAIKEEIITHFTIEKKADSTSASNITSLDNVLFIGDSITAGLNSSGLIPNATFKAESGTKPSDWLSKIDTLPQNSDDISCVCIMLGVNGTGEIEQMKQLIDSLSARYTGKTIFVQKVLPVANTYTNYETMNEGIKTYNDAISSYCNGKSSVKFIDTSAGYVDSSGAAKAELFDGEGLHPTNYQKLKENIEKAITGKTSSENLSANSSSKYSVVVGAWRQRFEERKAIGDEDPEEEYISGTTTYTMTTQKIDYQSMVSGYTMPFDYLWALLVTGREKDFVMDLADLVYNSEIEITIHDNYTEVTDVDTYEYTRKTKVNTHDITVTGSWSDTTYNGSTPPEKIHEENKEGSTGEIKKDYKIEHTIVTTTNTLDISLTKANVWIVNYAKKYTHEEENTIANEPITSDMPTVEYPDSPEKSDNADPCGIGAAFEKEVQAKYEDKDSVTTNMTCTSDYFYSVEGTVTNNNTVVTKKYTSSPAEITEKTDKNSDTDNFVTLFIDNYDFRNNILSAPDWLFEILEANQKTVDMVDLTKYLIYKATGISKYIMKEYDFSAFDPDNFTSVSNGIYGGTVEEKVWFALRDAGFSEYAVAGAMGNIYGESGFDPSIEEYETKIGFGLCQWSFGRRTQLEDYAASKGVDPSDVDTQIEFLITEITPGAVGPAQGYASYQLGSYKGYNGDMWVNATSPEEAAVAFCWSFERPQAPRLSVREEKAREYYEQFKGRTKPSGNIIDACNEVMQEFLNRNGRYSLSNLIWGDIERCWTDSECICCASYVSLVLYRAGALTPSQINAYNYQYTGPGGVSDMLQAAGWTMVAPSQAQPGDVIVDYNVHAMIYAGEGKVWDQSCCVISSKGNPPTRSTKTYNISGCQVWRAP